MEELLTSLIWDFRSCYGEQKKRKRDPTDDLQSNMDQLRRYYQKAFSTMDPMKIFRASAEAAIVAIEQSSCSMTGTSTEPYQIWFNGKLYTFPIETKMITLGRFPECDIKYEDNGTGNNSRIACMIYLCRETSEIALIDMGCFFGWDVVEDTKIKKSRPHNRKILYKDWGTPFVLVHQDQTFYFQPKMCELCAEKPRETRFNCGHKLCCKDCAVKLKDGTCPWCRKQIEKEKEKEGFSNESFIERSERSDPIRS